MSERLVGAVVAIHGDDKGLVLPPDIATNQVVIIPVLAKGETESVSKAARELHSELKAAGIRVHLDERDVRPGAKYFDWELKGVPLRLELGKRDMDIQKVTFVRRDTGEKSLRDRSSVVNDVRSTLSQIASDMLSRAQKEMTENTVTVDTLDNLPEKLIRTGWCGSEKCGHEIEARSDRNLLGTPVDGEQFSGSCAICGKPTKTLVYMARAM
jgi:prolyl-tRNA synthetase